MIAAKDLGEGALSKHPMVALRAARAKAAATRAGVTRMEMRCYGDRISVASGQLDMGNAIAVVLAVVLAGGQQIEVQIPIEPTDTIDSIAGRVGIAFLKLAELFDDRRKAAERGHS